ncbi:MULTISPECIES: hypothetical protein [unclassified Streptomyces]|uniref:zinc finger domain-containing protein n=1 Tax=unclassified Streptomyces TaxID=2593676 RepID=UPI0023666810|nr:MULTISPECIES: hypothetical protein [unclassified Streptomyces]MDF3141504.1 hypothetical protein [Streptomyces sp. T21Q-yed]WDF45015.1 hypothetical protein PBV52_50850 [Streptomyces sp. T12]
MQDNEIELLPDAAATSVTCPACGAPPGQLCPGTIGVHMARWVAAGSHDDPHDDHHHHGGGLHYSDTRAVPGTLVSLKQSQWRLTAEHEDGSRCPRTGKGRHRQLPERDPRCPGRAFYVARCRNCSWSCRKRKRTAVEEAAELHARFCSDQQPIRTPEQAILERNQRECRAFTVACPVCHAPAGQPCIDTKLASRAPYTHVDGAPRAHIKRRTLVSRSRR